MYNNKLVLSIIPARGGSKGLPKKNIRTIGGKPLVSYTLSEALKSKYIDRVIVSTDDKEIAEVALKYGGEVPFLRPKNLAKDTSTSLSVIIHTLDYLKKKEHYIPEIVVFLQPTSPFRTADHIDEGIRKIEDCDAVAGVSTVKVHPYFMMENRFGDELHPFLKMEKKPLRRQDVPELFYLNASLYISWADYFKNVNENDPVAPIFSGKVRAVFMDEVSSLDINNEFDFLLAKSIISSNVLKSNIKSDI